MEKNEVLTHLKNKYFSIRKEKWVCYILHNVYFIIILLFPFINEDI